MMKMKGKRILSRILTLCMQMAVVELDNSEGKDRGGAYLRLNTDYGKRYNN